MKLRDRMLIIKRALLLAIKPELSQVSILWVDAKRTQTHHIYEEGVDPARVADLYFSYAAADSKDFESLSERACYILNKIAVAYTHRKNLPLSSIQYTPEPFRLAEKQENKNV